LNGAELLVRSLAALGVEVCFANPGTTEIPIVMALDSVPGIKAFLGLCEGVCTGAADGYGRMLDKPAMTLLHLGPGFANGLANLHNARRARSPVLNVIGEHATWHRSADPPLAMDIEGLAGTVSGWWRTNQSVQEISVDVANAISTARLGKVATLIMPHDHQIAGCADHSFRELKTVFDPIDQHLIEGAASQLSKLQKVALLLGGRALRKPGLLTAARIKKAVGCDLFAPTLPGYMESGAGLPLVERIPYFPEQASAALSRYEAVLLAGANEPVTFFGYPGVWSRILTDEQEKITLCTERQNVIEALESFADAVGATARSVKDDNPLARVQRPTTPSGELTAEKACLTLAALQSENAIIIDEAVSTRYSYFPLAAMLAPHTMLAAAGGSLGYGIPCATGAAIACPDRPVIDLQADGSGLYTVQALWTQAREGLNVTTLICANRSYRILQMELHRAGITSYGPNTRRLTELANPSMNWVQIATGFGVPGATVGTAEGLARELGKALDESGPHLIEMVLP
jgi:acetolactate synthase-1/2/3 large subunit